MRLSQCGYCLCIRVLAHRMKYRIDCLNSCMGARVTHACYVCYVCRRTARLPAADNSCNFVRTMHALFLKLPAALFSFVCNTP